MKFIENYPYLYMFAPILFLGLFFSIPAFKIKKQNPTGARYQSVDGMRFVLASCVAIFHSLMILNINLTNSLDPNNLAVPSASFGKFGYVAGISVSLFFLITGFLFWGAIKKDNVNWEKLYYKRIFRISPLIIFQSMISIILLSVITIDSDNWRLPIRATMSWLDIFNDTKPPINGYANSSVTTAGVYWTLVYEWGFYFSLPLLWFFRKNSKEFVIASLFLIVYGSSYFQSFNIPFQYIILFFLGMLSLELKDSFSFNKYTLDIALLISILCLLTIYPAIYTVSSYSNLLLFIIMFCLVNKADLFGLLKLSGFVFLGQISYSIYIMHAIVFFVLYGFVFNLEYLSSNFIIISYIAYFIVIIVSCFTYKYVELLSYNFAKKFI